MSEKKRYDRLLAIQNGLSHIKTTSSRRRTTWEYDFRSFGNPFTIDTGVIYESKAWRRMASKNQVASSPNIPHLRNRATHVTEVKAQSIRIADNLGLNVWLADSIASGHDIGHVPFGHQGEHYLQQRMGIKFTHEVMGVIIAQKIERKGIGLNLTWETLDGMWRHSGNNAIDAMTPEAWVVRYADKIAYLFADYNDFARLRHVCAPELATLMNWFGPNQRARTFSTMICLCEESCEAGKVQFKESEAATKFEELRNLMYKEYVRIVDQNVESKLEPIYAFLERNGQIPPWLGIALMTDEEVCNIVHDPHMLSSRSLMDTGMGEIINLVPRDHLFSINPLDLDLDW